MVLPLQLQLLLFHRLSLLQLLGAHFTLAHGWIAL
jgi:hypothetical protein